MAQMAEAGHRVVLDFLDECQTVAHLGAVGDFQFHEQMLTHRVAEHFADCTAANLQVERLRAAPIDHRRDQPRALDFFYRITSGDNARLRRQFSLLGHI